MLIRSLTAGLLMAGIASAAFAGDPPARKPGDQVTFCSTVVALVEAGCIGVMQNGETFEIGAASPKPAVGTLISGTGTVSGDMTTCQQGIHLNPVTWQAAEVCTQAEGQAQSY